jgi:hypothetical protein
MKAKASSEKINKELTITSFIDRNLKTPFFILSSL